MKNQKRSGLSATTLTILNACRDVVSIGRWWCIIGWYSERVGAAGTSSTGVDNYMCNGPINSRLVSEAAVSGSRERANECQLICVY